MKAIKRKSIYRKYKRDNIDSELKNIRNNYLEGHLQIAYPIIGGYSDLAIVAADNIKKFSSYCRCFAKSGLYAEMAIPTSLLLIGGTIQTEKDTKQKMFREWPWDSHNIQKQADKNKKQADEYNSKKEMLMKDFSENLLYIHPIKLSAWDIKNI